jgi:hypothetical protein
MRRILIEGDKKMVVEKLETALADLKEDDRGYVQATASADSQPNVEIEFAGHDPSEDPEGDWSDLFVSYEEVPD